MQRSPGLDSQTEGRICNAILNLLNDDSADVQAIAVRTLTTLYSICTPQLRTIASTLLGRLLCEDSDTSGKSSGLRDVYANGLKKLLAVLATLDSQLQVQVVTVCIDPLLRGVVAKSDDKDVALFSMEVLSELMLHFGNCDIVVAQGERIIGILLGVLRSDRADLTKRAIPCLGRTTAHLGVPLIERTVDTLVGEIKVGGTLTSVYVQTLSSLTQYCGHSLKGKGPIILNILIKFIEPLGDDNVEDEDEDEMHVKNQLRESTFTAISSLITSTPSILISPDTSNLQKVLDSIIFFLKYDPNYYDDDDEDESMQEESDYGSGDDDDDFEAYGGDEDDDESWKIRRAALRCATSLINLCNVIKDSEVRASFEACLWSTNIGKLSLGDALMSRMKSERENHVLVDALTAFNSLIEHTKAKDILIGPKKSQILSSCTSLLQSKGADIKINVLDILGLMNNVCVGDNGESEQVRQHVVALLADDSKNLKHASLSYLISLPATIPTDDDLDKVVQLCQTQGEWYKIHALALDVLARFAQAYEQVSCDAARKIFSALCLTFSQPDLDASIKASTLMCAAALLSSNLASSLSHGNIECCIRFACEKCEEASVRNTSLKALSTICSSDKIDFTPYFASTLTILNTLLSKEQKLSIEYIRTFKQRILEVLLALLPRAASLTTSDSSTSSAVDMALSEILRQVGDLITPTDLHISYMAIRTASCTLALKLEDMGNIPKLVADNILAPSLVLVSSPLIVRSDDPCLNSVADILSILVKSKAVEFRPLYTDIHSRAVTLSDNDLATSKRILHNLAICIASITAVACKTESNEVQSELLSVVSSPENDLQLALGLYTLGELGQRLDLTNLNSSSKLYAMLLNYLEGDKSEDIKYCAAYAVGHLCIGSMSTFLTLLLDSFEETSSKRKTQYLLLSSLKEVIVYHHVHKQDYAIIDSIPVIVPHLTRHFSQKEEGVRTMVAECMGALAALHPEVILNKLADISKQSLDNDKRSAWTVINSVRFSVVNGIDGSELQKFLSNFISLLDDDELEVKTACLLMINSMVHYQAGLFTGDDKIFSEKILPRLNELSTLKKKREVHLGPFKEIVDDALPMRRASMSLFATCLKNCPHLLDIETFMPILATSLGDVQDAQLQAHQIVITMCSQHPSALLSAVNSFVLPLEKTCKTTIKGQKTASEIERINEWIKSALRVTILLSRLDGIEHQQEFCDFFNRVKANSNLNETLASLREELKS